MKWEDIVKKLTGTENNVVIISRSPKGRVRIASTYSAKDHDNIVSLILLAYGLETTECGPDCVHGKIEGDRQR